MYFSKAVFLGQRRFQKALKPVDVTLAGIWRKYLTFVVNISYFIITSTGKNSMAVSSPLLSSTAMWSAAS